MVQPAKTRITAEEYFASDAHQQLDLIELVDGIVILGKASTPRHQLIAGEILFQFALKSRQAGGKALSRPTEVYLDEENIFEPDVLYLKPDSQCTVGEKRLTGAPELVVEVLSPSTARYDRLQKYRAYEKHGVNEYWIVDPVHETLEVWMLIEGKFERQGVYAAGDSLKSETLEETITVSDIFQV